MNYVNHVITEDSATIIFNDNGETVVKTVRSDNGMFDNIYKAVLAHNFDELPALCDKALMIRDHGDNRFEVKSGRVYVENEPLPTGLSNILMNLLDTGCNLTPLLKFWDNLKKNPSARSVQCLYSFLEANNCTITPDGYFIGYKAVRNDYMDKYSGKIDNHVGEEPEMDRNKVDDDFEKTCSFGLHVAAFGYAANSYGSKSSGDRLLAVKVNPADVVAVPTDYNNSKIRACKYKVVEDITDEWKEKTTPLYLEEDGVFKDEDSCPEYCEECDEYCEECGCAFDKECDCAPDNDEEDEPKHSVYQAFVTKDGRIEIPQQAIKDYNIKSIQHIAGMEFEYSTLIKFDSDWINVNSNGRIVIPKSVVSKASCNSLNYQDERFIEVHVDGQLFLYCL